MVIIIRVTQEHINHGIQYNCTGCPVALAIKERVNKHVKTTGDYIRFYKDQGGPILVLATPNEARRFIFAFDGNKPVEPFSFALDIPKEFLKL